jgi:DNA-binding GntR family transcriptional regulator
MEKKFEIGEINKTPLRETIAHTVRVSIVKGQLKPGEKLSEPIIAEQLGVSRTPIREAFFKLESEGLVAVLPRRGAIVSEISVINAKELYIVRSVLEGLAMKICSKNITDESLDKLKDINDKLFKSIKEGNNNFEEIVELNDKFHDIIICSAGNDILSQTIDLMRKRITRYYFIYLSVVDHTKISVEEHEEIIKVLSRKDSEGSERIMRKHIENGGKRVCEYIKKILV